MNKPMKNTLPPLTQEEFCNILEMLKSEDKECNILAKELLRPFVYEINENKICLIKDFFFLNVNMAIDSNGRNRSMSGPIPI